jgi:tRNA (guanine-N7-)-methyltransferase
MTASEHATFLAAAERALWKPADVFKRADLSDIFERPAPLEVDFGCGDGAFILAMAEAHPERNFLGTERMLGRVEKVSRHVAHRGLTNVRVLRLESAYVARHLLPLGMIARAHVLFPDPWPKRHHHPRRLVQPEFLNSVRDVLVPGGELRMKTDDLPYFRWMEKVIEGAPGWERVEWPDDEPYPVTDFERRFLAQGLPIHRVRLRKV